MMIAGAGGSGVATVSAASPADATGLSAPVPSDSPDRTPASSVIGALLAPAGTGTTTVPDTVAALASSGMSLEVRMAPGASAPSTWTFTTPYSCAATALPSFVSPPAACCRPVASLVRPSRIAGTPARIVLTPPCAASALPLAALASAMPFAASLAAFFAVLPALVALLAAFLMAVFWPRSNFDSFGGLVAAPAAGAPTSARDVAATAAVSSCRRTAWDIEGLLPGTVGPASSADAGENLCGP